MRPQTHLPLEGGGRCKAAGGGDTRLGDSGDPDKRSPHPGPPVRPSPSRGGWRPADNPLMLRWAPQLPTKHEASTLPAGGGDVGAADRGRYAAAKGSRQWGRRVKPPPPRGEGCGEGLGGEKPPYSAAFGNSSASTSTGNGSIS